MLVLCVNQCKIKKSWLNLFIKQILTKNLIITTHFEYSKT